MPRNTGDIDDDDRANARPPNASATGARAVDPPDGDAADGDTAGDRTSAIGGGLRPPTLIRTQLRRYRRGRHSANWRFDPRLATVAAAVAVAAVSGSAWAIAAPSDRPATSPALVVSDAADREAASGSAASRSYVRTTAPAATPQARSATTKRKPSKAATKRADPTRPTGSPAASPPAPPAPSPTRPAPVGGLSQAEMDNAVAIVRAGQQMNLPRRAFVVAIATALQESHLRNLANSNLPASLNHPNQGVGADHASVGLFQQQPNWGTVDQLMDPMEAARRFYNALVAIPGWDQLDVTVAAQRVQVSAFPDAYAKWQELAEQIANAIAG